MFKHQILFLTGLLIILQLVGAETFNFEWLKVNNGK
jgi:hypothetical protein